jgi:hypothetical protein
MTLLDKMWIDIVCLAVSVGLFEGALTGKGTSVGRGGRRVYWSVAPWLRPIFAIVGFGLFAFVLIDFFRKLLS